MTQMLMTHLWQASLPVLVTYLSSVAPLPLYLFSYNLLIRDCFIFVFIHMCFSYQLQLSISPLRQELLQSPGLGPHHLVFLFMSELHLYGNYPWQCYSLLSCYCIIVWSLIGCRTLSIASSLFRTTGLLLYYLYLSCMFIYLFQDWGSLE